MIVNLQLIAGDTHAVKYKKTFVYNFPLLVGDNLEAEPVAALTTWKNIAAIETDMPGVSAAFRSAMSDIAKNIVNQLQSDLSVAPVEST